MAQVRLKLISLLCKETEDWIGEDELYMLINGTRVWAGDLNNGQSADLRAVGAVPFDNSAEIRLFDDDPGDDNHLGTAHVYANTVGHGSQTAMFTQDGANYVLTYEVLSIPAPIPPTPGRLKLISLLCNVTEDDFGGDEPYLKINGIRVWSGSLNNNQSADLSYIGAVDFNGSASIELFDEDVGWFDSDDNLGTAYASANTAGLGEQRAQFTGDGANYVLTFKVLNMTTSPDTGGGIDPSYSVGSGSQKPTLPSTPPEPVLSRIEKLAADAKTLAGTPIVVNKNSKEIHRPTCKWSGRISSKNRYPSKGSIDGQNAPGLILDGHDGCAYCLPIIHYK